MFNFTKNKIDDFRTMFATFALVYTVHSINKETSKYGVYYRVENVKEKEENKKENITIGKIKILGLELYYYF